MQQFTYSLSVRPINVWPRPQSPPSSTTPTPSPPSSLLRGKHSQPDLIAQEENEGDSLKKKKNVITGIQPLSAIVTHFLISLHLLIFFK